MSRSRSLRLRPRSRSPATASWLSLMAVSMLWVSGCREPPPTTHALPDSQAIADLAIAGEEDVAQLPLPIEHDTYELPTSVVQVVTIPAGSDHTLTVVLSDALETLTNMARAADAISAINAGFFDPQNGLTTSFVTVNGAIAADPQQNPRLMDNSDLQAFLPAILNRSEFRIYNCDDGTRYDITVRATPVPANCILQGAVGAGPQLLPVMTGYEEGFLTDNEQGETVRDAVGSQSPNARSAVGLQADGTVVLAIATQLPSADTSAGLTLPEMAAFLSSLGVQKALNLDGGSSTGLYLEGQTYWGRLNPAGEPIERPIKSILVVR